MKLAALAIITGIAPLWNIDGTPLEDLATVRLYVDNGAVIDQPWVAPGGEFTFVYPVNVLLERRCFVATAIDETGNESAPSNQTCTTRWRCYKCHQ